MNADVTLQALVRKCMAEGLIGASRVHRRIPGELLTFHSTPLVTVRRTAWRNALRELEWLMYGEGLIENLAVPCRHWWLRWADAGAVPGVGVGDLEDLVDRVLRQPHSRRLIARTAWAVDAAVPSNDFVAQVTTSADRTRLELFVFQRTCDLMRGAPHNWLQLWALGMWLAARTGHQFTTLRWIAGDMHLYETHARAASAMLDAPPAVGPGLVLNITGERFCADDFTLSGPYSPAACEPLEYV